MFLDCKTRSFNLQPICFACVARLDRFNTNCTEQGRAGAAQERRQNSDLLQARPASMAALLQRPDCAGAPSGRYEKLWIAGQSAKN